MLSEQQKLAVNHIKGPIMIIAGPGAGKTKVITERIINIINRGTEISNILALTFTNKAAKEMQDRISANSNIKATEKIWMGTFHSVFAKILREEHQSTDFSINFTIYDNEDSLKLIRRIIKDKNLDKETYIAKQIFSKISILKNNMIKPEQYRTNSELMQLDKINKREHFVTIYKLYNQECLNANAMDFDDILVYTHNLFINNKDTLEIYQDIFKYILIDEYQDTNKIQDAIVRLLAKKTQNICVVGDDSQSIYSFRGANIQNMLKFKINFPSLTEYKLEENYRSTQNIINTANSLIAYNKDKIPKTIWTKNKEGERVKITSYPSHIQEGENIACAIHKLTKHNQSERKNYAILYRTNSQSKPIEDGLRKYNIPYVIFGGVSFYQRKEIKDILSYLRLIANPDDNEAIIRIINFPTRGIGNTSIEKLRKHASHSSLSIWKLISSELTYDIGVSNSIITKIIEFIDIIKTCRESSEKNNVFDVLEMLIEKTKIIEKLTEESNLDNINRLENIGELFNTVKLFSENNKHNSVQDFLNEVALLTDNKTKNKHKNFVSLMTIHQSKGLEFKDIYIVGLEEGLFPSPQSAYDKTKIEEERRLLYVAITRGIDRVNISYAKKRQRFGKWSEFEKSRFLEELSPIYTHQINEFSTFNSKFFTQRNTPKLAHKKLAKIPKKNYTPNDTKISISAGQHIIHDIFGKGEVLKEFIKDGNQRIKVQFQSYDEPKILITKFSKFKIIS